MAYRCAIVDDSKTDAEFVQSILNSWPSFWLRSDTFEHIPVLAVVSV